MEAEVSRFEMISNTSEAHQFNLRIILMAPFLGS
jgi:hypothetical protein